MIKNDKQYQVTKNRLKEFKAALKELQSQADVDPLLRQLQEGSVISQIEDFEIEINEYENLKKGNFNFFVVDSLEQLPAAFIKGRIAKGWSQAELASELNMKEQQIQRYESCEYATASLPRLIEVANKLDLNFPQIKIKIGHPKFLFPENMQSSTLRSAQTRLTSRKCLIEV